MTHHQGGSSFSSRRFLAAAVSCAKVREYDRSFAYISSSWLDFPLPTLNKGLEGLTCLNRGGQTYLLGLCEGNRCRAGAAGRRPGGGRIQVFARGGKGWEHVDTIRLPKSLPFKDHSSLAHAGDRLCVVSQESSALWIGRLAESEWRVADDLGVYEFPRNENGKCVYCTVEGVSWLSEDRIVVVSDKAKPQQPQRCRATDQSIHVFAIPSASERADRARVDSQRHRVNAAPGRPEGPGSRTPPLPVRGLFDQRIHGDHALLELARLRFGQSGLAAETYADSPSRLEWVLGFVAPHATLPVVHLSREVDLLTERGREIVEDFAARFAGRIWGMVVHDKSEMAARTDELVMRMQELGSRLHGGPYLFLEYAAGLEPAWFAELGEKLRDVERVSLCIDVGHVGIRAARHSFSRTHPDLDLAALTPDDPRLPELVDEVQSATESALPTVLELIRTLGRTGKPLHFHLHDGHPLIPGLSDHFSFLTQIPIPFLHDGRTSLPSMFGPSGLADLVRTAIDACGTQQLSLTLEIHQADGRLPLGDAADLFRHWRDTTNAERMNHWLSVLSQNAMLVTAASRAPGPTRS